MIFSHTSGWPVTNRPNSLFLYTHFTNQSKQKDNSFVFLKPYA